MVYTVKQSKDPEMYEFWNEYTIAKKKQPMLCMIIHSDCLDQNIVNTVKEAGEAEVYFNLAGE